MDGEGISHCGSLAMVACSRSGDRLGWTRCGGRQGAVFVSSNPAACFFHPNHTHTHAYRHNKSFESRIPSIPVPSALASEDDTPLEGKQETGMSHPVPCKQNTPIPPNTQYASQPHKHTYLVLYQILCSGQDLLPSGREGHAQTGSVEGRDRGQAEKEDDGRHARHRAMHVCFLCACESGICEFVDASEELQTYVPIRDVRKKMLVHRRKQSSGPYGGQGVREARRQGKWGNGSETWAKHTHKVSLHTHQSQQGIASHGT